MRLPSQREIGINLQPGNDPAAVLIFPGDDPLVARFQFVEGNRLLVASDQRVGFSANGYWKSHWLAKLALGILDFDDHGLLGRQAIDQLEALVRNVLRNIDVAVQNADGLPR